jgi:hypothetical protein
LERRNGEKRVEFRLPSREASAEREERPAGPPHLSGPPASRLLGRTEPGGQLARIFSEGGLLEELR